MAEEINLYRYNPPNKKHYLYNSLVRVLKREEGEVFFEVEYSDKNKNHRGVKSVTYYDSLRELNMTPLEQFVYLTDLLERQDGR